MEVLVEPVLEVFTKYEFKIQRPPSYVEFYTKTSNDIVLVIEQDKQSVANNKTEKDKKSQKEELELTGSPLKLDLSLHTTLDDTLFLTEPQLWLKDESSHLPLPIDKAREVANLYNELLQEHDEDQTIPMWILCDPRADNHPLLLTIYSFKNNFRRGIVNYEGCRSIQHIDVDSLVEKYVKRASTSDHSVKVDIHCKYLLAGTSYDPDKCIEELLNSSHSGATNLYCEWTDRSIEVPIINCKVNIEQEVIIGHINSPCYNMWKSVCAVHSINQLLVDMTASGSSNINLNNAFIRKDHMPKRNHENDKRLKELLNEVEMYTYMVQRQKGGCICITDDTKTLAECLESMQKNGSSNDFTYRLWDILRDCDTAEELITLLIRALKVISSGKMKPFIDANNKTYLGKLALRLSRGHSQAARALRLLGAGGGAGGGAGAARALSLAAQLAVEKTTWEYSRLMSLVEHSFLIAGIWAAEVASSESIEQINQTIYDMTMCGDHTLNPFDNKSTGDASIRFESESFYEEDVHELTVDDFASLKKIGAAKDEPANEVPLIVDEIDTSSWKNLLMKFTQVHVCLEHLNRAQQCLRADFESLKPLATRLREHYVSDRSPIKTVGQMINDPIQKVVMHIDNTIVQSHLKKPAYWYRIKITGENKHPEASLQREMSEIYAYTQQAVFPPSVWQHLDKQNEAVEGTIIGADIKYHCTKYTSISNQFPSTLAGK